MNRLPTDLLIYALIFVAILLFNYLARRIAKWQKQQESPPQDAPPPRESAPPEPQPREQQAEIFGRGPQRPEPREPRAPRETAVRARRAEAPLAAAAAQRGQKVRSFLAGRHNLRRAIIAMAVLGPCRAQQPPDDLR
ncbi:MAG TPA: hypothetical protein VFR86_20795 [Burkholderiaceae bacterium]|nr:hypothetical protein [Burkholderiaceae bacterium]